MADIQAIKNYRMKLKELKQSLAIAISEERPQEIERLEKEGDRILEQLKSLTTPISGSGGYIRYFHDERDKARTSVGNAISRAFAKIGMHCPALERYLMNNLKNKAGESPSYAPPPDDPIKWQF